jgi:hypothetical protein
MTTKFVVRLMGKGDMLAWAEVYAEPSPQAGRASCPLFVVGKGPTKFLIEQSGLVTHMTIHWPDLDVVRSREMTPTPVQAGQVMEFLWIEPVWLVVGMKDITLPPVTVRAPVIVAPVMGGLAAATHA